MLGSHALAAGSSSLAVQRVDLLTAIMHEMGHVLGYGHSDSLDLMYPTLTLGTRRSLDRLPVSSLEGVGAGMAQNMQLVDTCILDQIYASFNDNGKRQTI